MQNSWSQPVAQQIPFLPIQTPSPEGQIVVVNVTVCSAAGNMVALVAPSPLCANDVAGSDVDGSDVVGSDLVGNDVVGNDVVGNEVVGNDVVGIVDLGFTVEF